MNHVNFLLTLALALLVLAPATTAQEMQVEGYGVYVPGDTDDIALADGGTLSSGRLRGVLIEEDMGSPLHLISQTCAATDVFGSDASHVQSVGGCTAVDADGDLYYVSFHNTPEGGMWRFIGGTGKFAGVEGGGTTENVAFGPDGRVTIRYEGTMTLH